MGTSNMKMFVVLALAACAFAEPEADPAVLLGNGVYAPSQYNAGLYSNVVRPYVSTVNRVVSTPLVSSYRYASPLVSALSPVHAIGKREAEAEPEADAQFISTYAAGLPLTNTYAAPISTYTTAAHVATPVSTYAAHVAAPVSTYTTAAHVAAPISTY